MTDARIVEGASGETPRRPEVETMMAGTGAATIRELLTGGATVNMPGVYDALTARLADEAGFEVLFVSG
ncbi:MAG: hypothetical protein M3N57_10740, partial [Actinomycetota bacterium]|nr:hypothetical protein [Actinomycetota bacterium]